MIADGSTHVVLGATWGWRVLSPTAPYSEGAAYNDADTQKALILMTDGENNQGIRPDQFFTYYRGLPRETASIRMFPILFGERAGSRR